MGYHQCRKSLSVSHPRLPVLGLGHLFQEACNPGERPQNFFILASVGLTGFYNHSICSENGWVSKNVLPFIITVVFACFTTCNPMSEMSNKLRKSHSTCPSGVLIAFIAVQPPYLIRKGKYLTFSAI